MRARILVACGLVYVTAVIVLWPEVSLVIRNLIGAVL